MDQIDQIMAVMAASFDPLWGEAWNRRQVEDSLALHNTTALVIDAKGQLIDDDQSQAVGFLMARHAPGESELLLIAILPEYRSRGLGIRLIELLYNQVRDLGGDRIFLEMRENNPAIRLYKKVGFEQIGRRPNYYRVANGSRLDALTFGLTVQDEAGQ